MSQTEEKICVTKGFDCKYPSNVTFVSVSNASGPQLSGTTPAYSSIRFVDDAPVASPSSQRSKSLSNVQVSQTYGHLAADALDSALDLNDTIDHVEFDIPEPIPQSNRGTSSAFVNHLDRTFEGGDLETALLRHYCYALAPWIDVGDTTRAFGLTLLILGRKARPLMAAILALTAYQRSLISTSSAAEDLASSVHYREEAERDLGRQVHVVQRSVTAVLMLQSFFSSHPSRWEILVADHMDVFRSCALSISLEDEPLGALFWLPFRIDLAASIISSKAPKIPFRSFAPSSQPDSIQQIYQRILILLAHTLTWTWGDHTSEVGPEPNLVSQWTYLWNECRRWYQSLPVPVQPILDIRAVDADLIDPQNASSFPILIYTTSLALVANAVYHITCFLLLTHKPRFVKTLPGPRCFSSHIWHAQSLVGITTSNDTIEQWDPVVIAGFLTVARAMTHESQQSAVLHRLRKITLLTGIKLDHEIEALKSQWRMACDDDNFG
ncbi:uncharacterized protein ACLA_099290 [Aspergillus clavatus NRRL 1]|uniref:Transcription factor domain-containing protein n=1 Tax=Aspergillus clavatus (strain ATCC 1007 / CBS 513.65 / DSM 816 / NCTC 3887 / NRRL 1 / QM 1276 / 107) TaxID=344612 RepID=A1CN47_ASPCL|nr:uncharacterized protein ACLA_099290 [Aspergillus clavatus NRRL 1]EAW08984.1 conserved hypothetical protein [Aspergillus clavatus NRRL 1]